jgi:hypothetical protein
MKTFTLIIFSLIIYSFQSQAQKQELLDNTWYLEKVVIDDEDIFVPDDLIIEYAEFYENYFDTQSSCNLLDGEISFNDDNSNFAILNFGLTLENCLDDEIGEFESFYLLDFFNYPDPDFNNPFNYSTEEISQSVLKLIVTNKNDDKAIYYSQTLSTEDIDGFGTVRLYPNPAQNEFSIESDVDIKQIKMYNQLGQVVLGFDDIKPQPSYNISVLSKGVYFVELSSVQGKKTVKKLVKQ